MTAARKITTTALLIAAVFSLAATGDPQTTVRFDEPEKPVSVIRGTQQDHGEPKNPVSRPGPVAQQAGRRENGVIVMRPAPGGFMRETTRLAAEAEVRDSRSTQDEARETDRQLRCMDRLACSRTS